MRSGNRTEVLQFSSKRLYPLSHPIGSELHLVVPALSFSVYVGPLLSSALSVSKILHLLSDFRNVFTVLRL